jgi:hypothetical protein
MKIVRDSLWSTLDELVANKRPDWQRVSGTWVSAWVQSGGTPIEKQVHALGHLLRRHDREAMIREIGMALRSLEEFEMPAAA